MYKLKPFFGILLLLLVMFEESLTNSDEKTSAWENENEGTGSNSSCEEHETPCADGNGCLYSEFRCDGFLDCDDLSDEAPELCKDNCLDISGRFQCADQTCIRLGGVCNGISQCPDGSDEDLELCTNCAGDPFKTKCEASTQCIEKSSVCDSEFDCGMDDTSDEDPRFCNDNCGGINERFQCANKKCINVYKACNGISDCDDGSDERDEVCANCNGDPERFKCAMTSKCIPKNDVCDGWNHCSYKLASDKRLEDRSDEENCADILY